MKERPSASGMATKAEEVQMQSKAPKGKEGNPVEASSSFGKHSKSGGQPAKTMTIVSPKRANNPPKRTRVRDVTDVRQMEQGLLQLLDDFHSGKLQAFGKDITFEKMESVREQQERLARLHFDLNAQQEIYGHDSEEGRRIAKENMTKLKDNLQQLSNSIEQLQSKSSGTNFATGSESNHKQKEKIVFQL